MKKFARATILNILECAKKEFVNDPKALYHVNFSYKGNYVIAFCDPVPEDIGWTISSFKVVYSRCVMSYTCGSDYTKTDAYIA